MTTSPNTVPAVVALNDAGAALGRKLIKIAGYGELHGFADRVSTPDVPFSTVQVHLRDLFQANRTIIAIMSSGIVIRALGGLVQDKRNEAPVLCVSEGGSSVVPLLGGHRGANKLALKLAEGLDTKAAITTAGESRFGVALDDPPAGWRCSNPEAAKPVMAALLAGESVQLENGLEDGIDTNWLPFDEAGSSGPILALSKTPAAEGVFTLHPQTYVVGIGCERGVSADEVRALVMKSLTTAGIASGAVACLATIDLKEDEEAFRSLAAEMGLPLRLFTAAALEEETPRVTDPSDHVFEVVGCHSVSEAAALKAVGTEGGLVLPKQKSKRATCAIARAADIVDAESVGRGCGRLTIVGIGPGQASWRAPEATMAVAEATDVVGYFLYLDLLGDLAVGKIRHDYNLGEETDRVREALNLAAIGKNVVLVSSGDAGIYAMGSLVFELIDRDESGIWSRFPVSTVPGISALQAAAARAGAPLGHDFCTVSLSDLMTPWAVIEKRLTAAAAGDFVITLYNPVSKRRRHQFERAVEIISAHRPPETPVILARNLGREEETIDVLPLYDVEVDMVDMLTLVMIGSSESRVIEETNGNRRVYTPRGYGDKKP